MKTILLVDDSENDLMLMRMAFKKAAFNYPLQEVHHGQEAIDYLKGEGVYTERDKFPLPAVMLLDLNMPMKDGFAVLDWVRTQPALKRMSIIILTASMHMKDVERAFDLGAHSFLVKPATGGPRKPFIPRAAATPIALSYHWNTNKVLGC